MEFDLDIVREVEVETEVTTETEPTDQEEDKVDINSPNYATDFSDREYVSFEDDLHSKIKIKDIVEEAMEDLFAESDLEEDTDLPEQILADRVGFKVPMMSDRMKTKLEKYAVDSCSRKLKPGRRKVDDNEQSTIERQIKESEEFRATLERRPVKVESRTCEVVPNATSKQKKGYSCLTCQEIFVSHRALNQHQKSHSVDGESFQCPECSRKFTQPCNLRRHMRRHSGERPFKCPVCDKKFSDQGYLTTHIRYHSDVRPFVCTVCSKEFVDRSNFMKHAKTHSGERRYACSLCHMAFVQLSDLTRHARVHSGVRPYACDQCDRRYQQNGDLVQHKRQHTGERPFACLKCGRTFANKRYLQGHQRLLVCERAKTATQGQTL